MRHYIITALVLLSAFASALDMSAQNMKVTGTVFDNEGQSLPGAYVIRYDASKANILESVMVDIDGKFSINAAQGDILEFSFIGAAIPASDKNRGYSGNLFLSPRWGSNFGIIH